MAVELKEIIELVQARIYPPTSGRDVENMQITGAAGYEDAGPEEITFAVDDRHLKEALESRAGVILAPSDSDLLEGSCSLKGKVLLLVDAPRLAFARVLDIFVPREQLEPGIHDSAVVEESAVLGEDVVVAAGAVVGRKAVLGQGVVLGSGAVIGPEVEIGAETRISSGVVVERRSRIGKNCVIHAGAVIGAEGYGFVQREDGSHRKIPQIGRVVIGDDVEIGANTTIDRATTGITRIGRGTKIDNLVHVGHNCQIGEDVLLTAMVGLAGGVEIGDRVVMAGKSSAVEHVRIGEDSVIYGRGVVTRDLPPGSRVSGMPARPHEKTMRAQAVYQRLPELLKRVNSLEKYIEGQKGN